MRIALLPCSPTAWRRAGRLLGRVELPVDADALSERVATLVEPLRGLRFGKLMHAPDGLCTSMAQALTGPLGAAPRVVEALAEADMGLWAGLTDDQLRKRFSTAHRQLLEAPLSVQPPEGEDFGQACERVRASLEKSLRRNGREDCGIVLRPMCLALARYVLGDTRESDIWSRARGEDRPVVIDPARVAATAER